MHMKLSVYEAIHCQNYITILVNIYLRLDFPKYVCLITYYHTIDLTTGTAQDVCKYLFKFYYMFPTLTSDCIILFQLN